MTESDNVPVPTPAAKDATQGNEKTEEKGDAVFDAGVEECNRLLAGGEPKRGNFPHNMEAEGEQAKDFPNVPFPTNQKFDAKDTVSLRPVKI